MKLVERIKQKLKYELGITKLEEENDSLFFLLNNCLDITKIPPTKDFDLRILQKCDTLLLVIFDKLCKKYGLSYWLHWGTLLGAVRHRGFIPWDDDADVAVTREDYERMIPIMRKEIEELGLHIGYSDMHPMRGLVLSYDIKSGVWIDIFPVDSCQVSDEDELSYSIDKYRSFFWENMHLSTEELTLKKKEILSNCSSGDNIYLIPSLEIWQDAMVKVLYQSTEIFPLKKIEFEGFELNAPRRADIILKKSYGINYMNFPRHAINNHGQGGKPSLSQRAKSNGIDMCEVYRHLEAIYKSL